MSDEKFAAAAEAIIESRLAIANVLEQVEAARLLLLTTLAAVDRSRLALQDVNEALSKHWALLSPQV